MSALPRQCKDINEALIIRLITMDRLTHTSRIQEHTQIPNKLLLAKLRKMIQKKLITGCACGCRGDFEVTAKGATLL